MGRAGRHQKKGRAVLQSYSPDNLIIQALQKNDRSQFLAEEMMSRQVLSMPPFGRLASFIISGKNQTQAYQVAQNLVKTAPTNPELTVLGPVVAPISLLRGKYRFRILIKASRDFKRQKMLAFWLKQQKIPSAVEVRLDIDPYSFF